MNNTQLFLNGQFGKTRLKRLREDICLNSIYVSDYENRYNIDSQIICDFFMGYMDFLSENEDGTETDDLDEIFERDTIENLSLWYCLVQ